LSFSFVVQFCRSVLSLDQLTVRRSYACNVAEIISNADTTYRWNGFVLRNEMLSCSVQFDRYPAGPQISVICQNARIQNRLYCGESLNSIEPQHRNPIVTSTPTYCICSIKRVECFVIELCGLFEQANGQMISTARLGQRVCTIHMNLLPYILFAMSYRAMLSSQQLRRPFYRGCQYLQLVFGVHSVQLLTSSVTGTSNH
jgi:hypothetical protein